MDDLLTLNEIDALLGGVHTLRFYAWAEPIWRGGQAYYFKTDVETWLGRLLG